jgi:hypothetical protein
MNALQTAARRVVLAIGILTAALSVAAGDLGAQPSITCPGESSVPVQGAVCTATITGADPLQTLPVRVRITDGNTGIAGAVVRFRATSGTVLPDSVASDAEGYAQTLWYRAGGTDAAAIAVDARTQRGSAFREIRAAKAPAPRYALRTHSGDGASWFEKAPLRHPVVVEILRADAPVGTSRYITAEDSCASIRVAFTRVASGSLTPDTARATVDSAEVGENPDRLGCFARAYWTLGEGAGRRHVRAALVGGSATAANNNLTYEAYARALPRLIGGILVTYNRSFLGARSAGERTVRVERLLPDGSKLAYDSTFSTGRDTINSVDGNFGPAAFVGVSTPVVPRWHRFAVTFGVDPGSIDRNWYAGISLLRIPGGLAVESLPVDIHLLGHWGRTDVLVNRTACAERGECRTEDDVHWHGFAAMLSVDASSLLTELIKKLSGP